jgi:uncharacterized membrane protein
LTKKEREILQEKLRNKKDAYTGFCVIYISFSVLSLIASIFIKTKGINADNDYKNAASFMLGFNALFNFIVCCCVAYYNSFISESSIFALVIIFTVVVVLQSLSAASKGDSEKTKNNCENVLGELNEAKEEITKLNRQIQINSSNSESKIRTFMRQRDR